LMSWWNWDEIWSPLEYFLSLYIYHKYAVSYYIYIIIYHRIPWRYVPICAVLFFSPSWYMRVDWLLYRCQLHKKMGWCYNIIAFSKKHGECANVDSSWIQHVSWFNMFQPTNHSIEFLVASSWGKNLAMRF
jgi:hypothetical protein